MELCIHVVRCQNYADEKSGMALSVHLHRGLSSIKPVLFRGNTLGRSKCHISTDYSCHLQQISFTMERKSVNSQTGMSRIYCLHSQDIKTPMDMMSEAG